MTGSRHRLAASLVVFAIWIAITGFFMRLIEPATQQSLDAMVTARIGPQFIAAVIFLVVAVLLFRWRDMGFNAPRPARSLGRLWFPALYLVLFFGGAALFGLPSSGVMLIVFVNTCLVGISEELACRGVLLQGLRSRVSIWPAVLLSSLLFGAIHVINGFMTGDFTAAFIQALAAFMSGVLFAAIRLRTHSIIPCMVFHALWDFGTFTMLLASQQHASAGGATPSPFLPVLFVLPNFLYGLFLLRHAARDEREERRASA